LQLVLTTLAILIMTASATQAQQRPIQPQPIPNQFGNGFGAGGVNPQGGQGGLQVFGFGHQLGMPLQGGPIQQAQQMAEQLIRGMPFQFQGGNFGLGQVNLNGQNGTLNAGAFGVGGQQVPLNPGIPAQAPQQPAQNGLNPQPVSNPAAPQVPLNPVQRTTPNQQGVLSGNPTQTQPGQPIVTPSASPIREFIKQRADEVFGTKTASTTNGINQSGMQQQLNDLRDEVNQGNGFDGAAVGDNVARFMGIEAEGKNICIIADCSGSMAWGVKLPFVKQQILETVKALNNDQRFQVIFFHTLAVPYPRFGWRHPKTDLPTLEVWLGQVLPLGGTLPTPAFNYVFSNLNPKPDAIFFLTDGEFPTQVAPYIERLNLQAKIPIHTICYYSLAGERIMRFIASRSGGQFQAVGVQNQVPRPAAPKVP
jgi:hypothetical protein